MESHDDGVVVEGGFSGIRLDEPVNSLSSKGRWNVFGSHVPKEEIVFFSQVILIYVIAITSIVNLTLNTENSNLWTSLLSASLGYMLPAPNLSRK
jgi:hypothetical protein